MTDDEIKKGLELCPCRIDDDHCTLDVQFNCIRLLCAEALGLINRQAEEIERLKKR